MSKAMAGNLDALKKYVESGGAINVTDKMGNTLLMKAVVNDHLEVVEYLLSKGADPNCTNRIGETALDIAKQGAPKRVTRVLEQVTRKPRAAR